MGSFLIKICFFFVYNLVQMHVNKLVESERQLLVGKAFFLY